MSEDFVNVAKKIGEEQLESIKGKLGDLWNGFNEQDKDLAVKVAKDSAELQIESMRNPDRDLSAEWRHIDAQIKNLTSANMSSFRVAFWETIGGVVKSGIGGLINAGFKALTGLGG